MSDSFTTIELPKSCWCTERPKVEPRLRVPRGTPSAGACRLTIEEREKINKKFKRKRLKERKNKLLNGDFYLSYDEMLERGYFCKRCFHSYEYRTAIYDKYGKINGYKCHKCNTYWPVLNFLCPNCGIDNSHDEIIVEWSDVFWEGCKWTKWEDVVSKLSSLYCQNCETVFNVLDNIY